MISKNEIEGMPKFAETNEDMADLLATDALLTKKQQVNAITV